MAQDIILKNQVWDDVPAVNLPIDGGGMQRFTDVSGTTATPSDVASGKLFFDSTGTQQTGTSSGGSANLQTKTATYTPTTSQQTDTIRPDTGYDGLSLVNIIVNAMQSGVDMPTFTLSGIQEGSTVTCDKTYAEARTFYTNGMKVAVASTTGYGNLPVLVYEAGSDYLLYVAYYTDGTPLGDIRFTSSTITYTIDSTIIKEPRIPVAIKSTVTDHAMKVRVGVNYIKGFYDGGQVYGDPVYVSASEVVSGTKSISANGTGIDVTNYASVDVAVPTGGATLQTKTKTYTPSETAQSETVSPDSGYDGLSSVAVSVGAIPSNYVGSGVTRRDDDDLSGVDDDPHYMVVAQSGYYPNSAEFEVPAGELVGNVHVMVLTDEINLTIDEDGLISTDFYKGINANPVYNSGYIRNTKTLYASAGGYKTLQLTKRTSNDLTLSGGTVTAPSGYYPNDSSLTVAEDGNFLEYGLTDGTSPLVGVAKIGEAVLFETSPQIGTAQAGFTTVM